MPPPKNTAANSSANSGNDNTAAAESDKKEKNRPRAPISLKGSGPAFSRSTGDSEDEYDDMGAPVRRAGGGGMGLPPPRANGPSAVGKPAEEVELKNVGMAMKFKPLSVGRRPVKKKKASTGVGGGPSPAAGAATAGTVQAQGAVVGGQAQAPASTPKPKAKVSLFSVDADDEDDTSSAAPSAGIYQPMIYGASAHGEAAPTNPYTTSTHPPPPSSAQPDTTTTTSLTSIAADLNLSAAERRQLFGRCSHSASAHKVINFNTDEEYSRNEALRASGEPVKHNPVRAIAPGKHSLQQLVSQVQSQKEALEESFAQGKANKRGAASRYGW